MFDFAKDAIFKNLAPILIDKISEYAPFLEKIGIESHVLKQIDFASLITKTPQFPSPEILLELSNGILFKLISPNSNKLFDALQQKHQRKVVIIWSQEPIEDIPTEFVTVITMAYVDANGNPEPFIAFPITQLAEYIYNELFYKNTEAIDVTNQKQLHD